ncbi:MAG: hypothetical protein M1813_005986 [Trichoglossum hirsutum]|jgi:hypothetical protein|nr:MAG: hypothetical protein M1813_005986 [Trichoglossum hirsutum]
MLDLEKAETWPDLVRCHQGFIAPHKSTSDEGFHYGYLGFTFPGVTRLESTSCIGDAIVEARRWDDSAVLKERDIPLGSDGAIAWELINEIRARLKLKFVKAFQYVRENEMAAYGDWSFYWKARGEARLAADGDVSDSDVSEPSMLDEDAVRARMVAVRRGKDKGKSEAERMPDTNEENAQAVANDDDSEEDEEEDEESKDEDEDEDEVDE